MTRLGLGSYFDLDAKPITFGEWAALSKTHRRIARTEVGHRFVSTVWLGIDHGPDEQGRPLIFESMTFPENDPCERFATREEAEEGHAKMVAVVEALPPPPKPTPPPPWPKDQPCDLCGRVEDQLPNTEIKTKSCMKCRRPYQ